MPTKIYDYDPFFEKLKKEGKLGEIDDPGAGDTAETTTAINEILELLREIGIVKE